jgi:hypothetical protein
LVFTKIDENGQFSDQKLTSKFVQVRIG